MQFVVDSIDGGRCDGGGGGGESRLGGGGAGLSEMAAAPGLSFFLERLRAMKRRRSITAPMIAAGGMRGAYFGLRSCSRREGFFSTFKVTFVE